MIYQTKKYYKISPKKENIYSMET